MGEGVAGQGGDGVSGERHLGQGGGVGEAEGADGLEGCVLHLEGGGKEVEV